VTPFDPFRLSCLAVPNNHREHADTLAQRNGSSTAPIHKFSWATKNGHDFGWRNSFVRNPAIIKTQKLRPDQIEFSAKEWLASWINANVAEAISFIDAGAVNTIIDLPKLLARGLAFY
jgi:hypothetical protein